ncbi:hypothetical protein AB0B44_10435, partial [Streptomyces sp. NPDC041003]
MTDSGQEPEEDTRFDEESDEEFDEEGASLPVLLEAVLSVGSELELQATLQHIVDSATELCSARYGALGVVDPERALRHGQLPRRVVPPAPGNQPGPARGRGGQH